MKTLILSSVLAGSIMSLAFLPNRHSDIYSINTQLSKVEWFAEKIGGKHNGTINISSGEIENNHGMLAVKAEIDMSTIVDLDMQAGEWKTKLENHLKSADFFDAAKYPKAKFVSTSITPITEKKEGGFTHKVKGNLTIKDKTNPIEFDAIIKMEPTKIGCTGTAVVDRSKYDVKYGSKSFFPEIGDKMIYDEFKVKFLIVATR